MRMWRADYQQIRTAQAFLERQQVGVAADQRVGAQDLACLGGQQVSEQIGQARPGVV